ncbi:Zinc finger, C2H2 type [Aphelenchoides fujianensis]|nr:Zinc finger, C2H2 type [Aphelenchoides fujianensis]
MSHPSGKEFDHFQQTHALKSLPMMNGGGATSNGHPPTAPAHQWGNAPFMTSEMPPMYCLFKCSECQISKSSCEDLEIHIKIEHLNWLPFQCTHCGAQRASDNQMREHVHSHHKKTEYIYKYVDNMQAKRLLQGMIDRALSAAIQQMVARRPPPLPAAMMPPHKSNGAPPTTPNGAVAAKRQRLHDVLSRNISHEQDGELQRPSTSVSPDDDHDQRHLSPIDAAHLSDGRPLADDPAARLSTLFGGQKPSGADEEMDDSSVSSALLKTLEAASSMNQTSTNTEDLLKNVSSLFSVDLSQLDLQNVLNGVQGAESPAAASVGIKTPGSATSKKRNFANPQGTAKKRVLGECSRCNKPVTAGARQMHLFFHLSKDENVFRFKCLFDGCDVEHYRKDQMENHQSKMHGRIDHSMMEDRSVELYDRVQALSMELLGTRDQDPNRRKRPADETNGEEAPSMVENNPLAIFQKMLNTNKGAEENEEQKPTRPEDQIECQLCKKLILTRTRGFHLLRHLNDDLGIVRYTCKFCSFKHDRPQSVATHGKKEHGTEECVEDSLSKYTEEIKSLSKACFGLEQLFQKKSRRTDRTYPQAATSPAHSSDSGTTVSEQKAEKTAEESTDAYQSDAPTGLRVFTPSAANKESPKKFQTSGGSGGGGGSAKKKISNRRFGIRKPKSRKQRAEMAKQREVSVRIGGAMYFKKKGPEALYCEVCGQYVQNKLVNHVYTHLEKAELFLCPKCDLGNSDRNMVQKHLREFHTSPLNPVDNRLKYSSEIKEIIRQCFPSVFVDAPLPTAAEMEELKKTLNLSDAQLIIDGEGGNDEENESHASDSGAEFGEGDEDDTRPDGELEQDENAAEDEPMEAEVARAEEADEEPPAASPQTPVDFNLDCSV